MYFRPRNYSTPECIMVDCWLADRMKSAIQAILCNMWNMWNHNVKKKNYRQEYLRFFMFSAVLYKEKSRTIKWKVKKNARKDQVHLFDLPFIPSKEATAKNWRNHIRLLRLLHFRSARSSPFERKINDHLLYGSERRVLAYYRAWAMNNSTLWFVGNFLSNRLKYSHIVNLLRWRNSLCSTYMYVTNANLFGFSILLIKFDALHFRNIHRFSNGFYCLSLAGKWNRWTKINEKKRPKKFIV